MHVGERGVVSGVRRVDVGCRLCWAYQGLLCVITR